MSDLLITGSNAVRNSQLALNVVSNNIANVNTEGYVKQSLNYAETPSAVVGAVSIGTGAIADGISRAYDGLIEGALRSSESDLVAKEALLEYTNKLIDFLGDEEASLLPALGDFFDNVRGLANDASSTVRRDQLLASGGSLASRFNGIAAQLESFSTDSREALEDKVAQANELINELALVNKKLIRVQELSKQPPELLNLRDRLLRDLAGFVKTSVVEKANGSFELSIGSVDKVLVDKNGAGQLEVRFSRGDLQKLEIFQSSSSGESRINSPGGQLAGVLDFRDRILAPVSAGLEGVAASFLKNINAIHSNGVDLLGNTGKDLFMARPSFQFEYPDKSGRLQIVIEGDPNQHASNAYRAEFDNAKNMWKVRSSSGEVFLAHRDDASIEVDGLRISISGEAQDGDIVNITKESNIAANIKLSIEDHRLIAASGSHGLVAFDSNTGASSASLEIDRSDVKGSQPALAKLIENNLYAREGVSFQHSLDDAAFAIKAGEKDVKLRFDGQQLDSSELQVFTRGGVHLFGKKLEGPVAERILHEGNSFYQGVTYNDSYLNGGASEIRVDIANLSRTDGKLNINGELISTGLPVPSALEIVNLVNQVSETTGVVAEIENGKTLVLRNEAGKEGNQIDLGDESGLLTNVAGVAVPEDYLNNGWRAGVFSNASFNTAESGQRYLRQEAMFLGESIQNAINTTGNQIDFIGPGAMNLNGHALGALTLEADQVFSSQVAVDWLNTNIAEFELPLSAGLVTTVTINPDELTGLGGEIEINGVLIGQQQPFLDLREMASAINAAVDASGVEASVGLDGALTLRNSDAANRDAAILIGDASTAVPDRTGVYSSALEIVYDRGVGDDTEYEISLTLGQTGGFADFAKLGLKPVVELKGDLEEDLIVFVSGAEGGISRVSAEYSETTPNNNYLMDRSLRLEFTENDKYRFLDEKTGTVLTQGSYEPDTRLEFNGLMIEISGVPTTGDQFLISPLARGQGDTSTLARMSSLESAKIFEDSQSLQDGYLSVLGKAGSLSNQARVAREAYSVLKDQAEERREGLSGVNLDEEAGSLIRFQQSYQASARLVRTANELFDTIVRL